MKHQEGFTLIEIVLGVLIVLIVAMAVAPVFSQNLLLQEVQWDRKLAIKVIESELEQACNFVWIPPDDPPVGSDFDQLVSTPGLPFATPLPAELTNAIGTRTVACLDWNLNPTVPPINANGTCPDDPGTPAVEPVALKRVQVTLQWWTSQNRQMSEPSADYLISRTGACGTGA